MKIKFLGTRGEIEEETLRHRFHSSLLIEDKEFRLLIDHGIISYPLTKINPDAILITHGHPDHFLWLKKDEEYQGNIYLSKETEKVAKFKKNFKIFKTDQWFKLGPFTVLAYPVTHSLLAPAVGFKIKNDQTIIYNPDVLAIKNKAVLKGTDLYIGDGSSFKSNLVRRRGDKLFGHARMQTQINWCKRYQIKKIIFTHFGKEVLGLGDENLEKMLKEKNNEDIQIAYDGYEITPHTTIA